MNINITKSDSSAYFVALDSDSYDGAIDGNRIYTESKNKVHAVLDLLQKLYEDEIYTGEEILNYLGATEL
jgi:hypothetical protein